MFTAKQSNWATPHYIYSFLDRIFYFEHDLCADDSNAKSDSFITKRTDAFSVEWNGSCFMNPPYGKQIKNWVRKAYLEGSREGNTIVCLIPSRTDSSWWHDYVMKSAEIWFIRKRIKFQGAKYNAPFPSCVVIFNGNEGPIVKSISINHNGNDNIARQQEVSIGW